MSRKSRSATGGTAPAQAHVRASTARVVPAVCGLLVLAVVLVFGKTVAYDFVNYDDDKFVYENPMVLRGITGQGLVWACTSNAGGVAYPLTWISYMLDSHLFGTRPWGYHLTNVLLHAATVVILFLTLRRMTGNLWASAIVALLFAIHPLRAEAVAWVGERKGPLSGLFFVATIAAYTAYARHPFSLARYLLVAGLFILALLAKPNLVTLPFVLLLLDYWPLGRWNRRVGVAWRTSSPGALREPVENSDERAQGFDSVRNPPSSQRFAPRTLRADCRMGKDGVGSQGGLKSTLHLIIEKIPLFLISLAGSVVAVRSQVQVGNIASLTSLPMSARLANALVSYAVYLGQLFWPVGLAAYYPRPEYLPAWQVGVAFVVLAVLSIIAVLLWRKQPAVLVGWLWYLGTLVPMIGLVQIGTHARADRYTYLPHIGLCIALVWGVYWGVERLGGNWASRPWLYGTTGTLLVGGLMACAWQQTSYWQNSEQLWTHALDCTSNNSTAHDSLGLALASRGQVAAAIDQYRQALAIKPDYVKAHDNLGLALASRGQLAEAIVEYQTSLEIMPGDATARNDLGTALAQRGQFAAAIEHFRAAVAIKPDYVKAHYNLGNALADNRQFTAAIDEYRKTLEFRPDYAEAHYNLGVLLAQRGDVKEAMTHFQTAISLASARNDTALADRIRTRIKRFQ